jgi:hypothetical protein
VVCDLVKREIDSYLSVTGVSDQVNDISSDGELLYAATSAGIYKAELSSPNLVDYNSWEKLGFLPFSSSGYRFVAYYNNRLMSVYHNPVSGFDEIISISADSWEVWANCENDIFDYIGEQNGFLLVCMLEKTKVYNSQGQLIREDDTYYPKHALYDTQQVLWYAEPESGRIRVDPAGNASLIVPSGPAYREVGDIKISSGRLWAGGGTEASNGKGTSLFTCR